MLSSTSRGLFRCVMVTGLRSASAIMSPDFRERSLVEYSVMSPRSIIAVIYVNAARVFLDEIRTLIRLGGPVLGAVPRDRHPSFRGHSGQHQRLEEEARTPAGEDGRQLLRSGQRPTVRSWTF